jgi:hypothetical protein
MNVTLNNCNFSYNNCSRGAASFCEGVGGTAPFDATWMTVYRNAGGTGVETLRYSFHRISYANFIENYVKLGVVYANDYGMILSNCAFMGNGYYNIYRSNYNSPTSQEIFQLYDCYFDANLPLSQHAAVVTRVFTYTNTQFEIWHYENEYCEAQFGYDGGLFTATRNFSLSIEFPKTNSFTPTAIFTLPPPLIYSTGRYMFLLWKFLFMDAVG